MLKAGRLREHRWVFLLLLMVLALAIVCIVAFAQQRRHVMAVTATATAEEAEYLFGNLNDRLEFLATDLLVTFLSTTPQSQAEHESMTRPLVESNPFLLTINYISPERRIEFVSPFERNRTVVGLQIGIAAPRAALEAADASGVPHLSAPFEIVQGETGYSMMIPHHSGGFLEIVFKAASVFGASSPFRRGTDLALEIVDNLAVYRTEGYLGQLSRAAVYRSRAEGTVFGRTMTMSAVPADALLAKTTRFWQILGVGSLVSILLLMLGIVVVQARRVAERRHAEAILLKSEEKYRAIFDEARDGIVLIDAETGLIADCNREFERQTGRTLAELKEMHIWKLRPADQVEAAREKFFEIRETDSGESSELSYLRPDGEISPVEFISTKVDIGSRRYLQSLSRDVSERRRMEGQVQQSQLLASLGEMTAGIAHEVSNPLAAILLYSELVANVEASPQVKKDIRVIRSEAKRAAKIMKALLSYSRKQEPIARRMDLHRTVRKVIGMRRYQEQVRNIDVAVHEVDGPLLVRGNAAQLTQLFMNLIVNAEEAIEKSTDKKIVVATEKFGAWARISIADSGVGIPEEHLTKVFVPFFSTKPTGKGTGLGLATCHGIVTAHGGLIRAENNDMGGATFIVDFPLAGKAK